LPDLAGRILKGDQFEGESIEEFWNKGEFLMENCSRKNCMVFARTLKGEHLRENFSGKNLRENFKARENN